MSTLDTKHAMGLRGQPSYQPAGAGASSPRPEPGADLELTRKENARSQLREGELARSHLQGVYPGDLLATLASTASAGRSQKDWAESALRAYSNAISLDPLLAEAYVGRAAVYRFLERYADAKADLQRAERLGIADATLAVDNVEQRVKRRRLALIGAGLLVAGVCTLWLLRGSRPPPSSNNSAPVALTAPAPTQSTLTGVDARPSPPPPNVAAAPARPAPASVALRAPNPPVLPEQSPGPRQPQSSSAPRSVPPAAVSTAPTPSVRAHGSTTSEQSPGTLPPAVAAVDTQPAPPPEHGCVECDSMISSVASASALSQEEREMTKLACRSSEGSGADTYVDCVTTQITQLEDALPMPDLTKLAAIDRQLVQRACTRAAQNGPAAYRRCISSQLIGLAGAPDLPNLSALTAERRRAIELACRDSAAAGAAAFHSCADRQAKDARRGVPSAASTP